jgi:hypothetical protein
MPSVKQQQVPPVNPDPSSIPEKVNVESSWDDKFQLTESNLLSWLLGPYDKQRQMISEARKRMQDDGVSDKLIARCLGSYDTSTLENHFRETLKLVTNPKTQKLWDTFTLSQAGKISNAEIESVRAEHQGQEPPYYYITGIRRIHDNRGNPPKDYLTADFIFEGLCVGKREGHVNPEPNMKINTAATIGYRVPLRFTNESIRDEDGEEKRVVMLNSHIIDDIYTRIYEIPFSKEVFDAMMKHTKNGEVSLTITDLKNSKHYTAKNVEEFLTDDVTALIEGYIKPKPTNQYNFNINPDQLAAFMKYQAEHGTDPQYQ